MTLSQPIHRRGFTLAELIVAMGITAILLTLLVTVTSVAIDGWRVSRNKVRAARQARAALDQFSRDFESMVARSGNNFEWLYVETDKDKPGPQDNPSPNASQIMFFTAATDRYDGDIGGARDKGGDVSCVGYRLFYKDPITDSQDEDLSVFVLYRDLVNPDEAFEELLAQEELKEVFDMGETDIAITENFICENIFEMSVVFQVEYSERDSNDRLVTRHVRVPVLSTTGDESVKEFSLRGNGIFVDGALASEYGKGRIVAVDISISVLSDAGIGTLRTANFDPATKAKFLAKNTYRYSKSILVPQP